MDEIPRLVRDARKDEHTPLLTRDARQSPSITLGTIVGVTLLTALFLIGFIIGVHLLLVEERLLNLDDSFHFISRSSWTNAQPIADKSFTFTSPIRTVVITQTNTTDCHVDDVCRELIKSIQDLHMKERQLADILYNYLISSNGIVYEGRGFQHQSSLSNDSLVLGFIGNFTTSRNPTGLQKVMAQELISNLINENFLDDCYNVTVDGTFSDPLETTRAWLGDHLPGNCTQDV